MTPQEEQTLKQVRFNNRDFDTVTLKFEYKKDKGEVGCTRLYPGDFYDNKLTDQGLQRLSDFIFDVLILTTKGKKGRAKLDKKNIVINSYTISHARKYN